MNQSINLSRVLKEEGLETQQHQQNEILSKK